MFLLLVNCKKCLSRDTSNFLNIATPMFSVCVTGRMTRRYLYLQDKRKEFLIIPATYNAFICKLFEIWIKDVIFEQHYSY